VFTRTEGPNPARITNNIFNLQPSLVWFLFSGILCILARIISIPLPSLTAIAIAEMIGAICVANGFFYSSPLYFQSTRSSFP